MTVRVVDKETGKCTLGKYAIIRKGQVILYTGIISDPECGWRGCGLRMVLAADLATVTADEPTKELRQED
jgi:hypothetical protein